MLCVSKTFVSQGNGGKRDNKTNNTGQLHEKTVLLEVALPLTR